MLFFPYMSGRVECVARPSRGAPGSGLPNDARRSRAPGKALRAAARRIRRPRAPRLFDRRKRRFV